MNASGPMACPNDGTTLVMSERQGIEIDYCPTCRGVWLDRGELDKIIERSGVEQAAAQPAQPHPGHSYQGKPYKRRKSFLEELFD
ncbi:MAG: zf-TFIIB domain-containing protein [Sphingomonas sp.]|nr:zf-TFIIB domain-containing protein [Sphingomonas sp.]